MPKVLLSLATAQGQSWNARIRSPGRRDMVKVYAADNQSNTYRIVFD